MVPSVPRILVEWMRPFTGVFSSGIRRHVLVLVAGAVLSPGRRTVTAALRLMGLEQTPEFALYHRVLSTDRWSARLLARRVLGELITHLVPAGPIVLGLDDTIERRWGARIAARGIYRDPVRSSRGHFVKTSGLRWLCLMVLAPVPWAGSIWALPFLSVLAPSERYAQNRQRRHKKLTDWARQAVLQTKRWLPDRQLVVVADNSFSAVDFLQAVARHVCVVTRLRLDAALYEPPLPRAPQRKGRPRAKGARLPSLSARLADPATQWTPLTLRGWYGKTQRRLAIASGTALWHRPVAPCPPPRGHPLGAGARSGRPQRPASLPLHRPDRRARDALGLVCPTLAHGSNL
jgi:DDE superfamily endonuclease